MDWKSISEVVKNPLFIIVAIVLVAIIITFAVVVSKSASKNKVSEIEDEVVETKSEVKGYLAQVSKVDETVKAIKDDYNDFVKEFGGRFENYFNQFAYFEKSVYEILSQIPNAKVQDALEKFKIEYESKKKEIKELVGLPYNEFIEQLKARDNEIARLRGELQQVKDLLKAGEKVEENVEHGEQKGTND